MFSSDNETTFVSEFAKAYFIKGEPHPTFVEQNKKEFNNRRREVKSFLQARQVSEISEAQMLENVYDYVFTAFCLGSLEQQRNRERKISGDSSANDGTGHQHWIPSAFMEPFAVGNKKSKLYVDKIPPGIHPGDYENHVRVTVNSSDFREGDDNVGKFYPPELELALKNLETDYSHAMTRTHAGKDNIFSGIYNAWDFVTISTFIVTLSVRTNYKKEQKHPFFDDNIFFLLQEVPKKVSCLEFEYFQSRELFEAVSPGSRMPDGRLTSEVIGLSFAEDPVSTQNIGHNSIVVIPTVSYFCPISPKAYVWLRQRNCILSRAKIISDKGMVGYLLHQSMNNDHKSVFHKPDDLYYNPYFPFVKYRFTISEA